MPAAGGAVGRRGCEEEDTRRPSVLAGRGVVKESVPVLLRKEVGWREAEDCVAPPPPEVVAGLNKEEAGRRAMWRTSLRRRSQATNKNHKSSSRNLRSTLLKSCRELLHVGSFSIQDFPQPVRFLTVIQRQPLAWVFHSPLTQTSCRQNRSRSRDQGFLSMALKDQSEDARPVPG